MVNAIWFYLLPYSISLKLVSLSSLQLFVSTYFIFLTAISSDGDSGSAFRFSGVVVSLILSSWTRSCCTLQSNALNIFSESLGFVCYKQFKRKKNNIASCCYVAILRFFEKVDSDLWPRVITNLLKSGSNWTLFKYLYDLSCTCCHP